MSKNKQKIKKERKITGTPKIIKFDEKTWIEVDSYNYSVRYTADKYSHFPTLEDALYDVYEERLRKELSKEKCKDFLALLNKIYKTEEELRKFLKEFAKKDYREESKKINSET